MTHARILLPCALLLGFVVACSGEVVPAPALPPEPVVTAQVAVSPSAVPAAVEVNEVVYCRILTRIADKLEAEITGILQRPRLSDAEVASIVEKLSPVGARTLVAAALVDEGISGDAVAEFLRREPQAAERCAGDFEARVQVVGAKVTGMLEALARAASGPAIDFRSDLATSLQDAKAEGKGVLLVFRASWAMASTEMEKTTFVDSMVQKEVAARFIAVRIDATDDEEKAVKKTMSTYSVRGLPTLILLNSSGKEAKRFTELVNAEKLLEALKAVPTKITKDPLKP